MSYQQEQFKAIADKIREKTGTTDPIKPIDFANKIDEVYEAGLANGGGPTIDEDKIIQKTVAGKHIVRTPDISEIPNEVTIELTGNVTENTKVYRISKNLFDGIFETGAISSSTGNNSNATGYIRAKNYIRVYEGINYIFSTELVNTWSGIRVYEYDENYLKGVSE